MTSKLVVNNIEADAGVSTITFGSEISASTFTGNLTGNVTGNLTGNVTSSSTSTFSSGLNVTGGSVGIGTDNPDSTLSIRSSGAYGISLQQDLGNQLLSSRIFLGSSSGSTAIFNNTGSIVFHTGAIIGNTSGNERLRITSSGNIGIGTNNPSKPLQVHSDSSSAVLVTGYTPQIRFNSSVGDGTDADRVILGRASGNNQFIGGSVDGDAILRCATSKKVMIGYGTTEIAQFNSSGLKFKTSGMGIDFSATADATNGSNVSELFSDYEQGTWTATLTCATSGAVTLYNNAGHYTRVGNICHVGAWIRVNGTTTGSASGNITMGGFPFPAAAQGNYRGRIHITGYSFASISSGTWGWGVVEDDASAFQLGYGQTGWNTFVSFTGTNIASTNAEFYVNGFYKVA